MKYQVVSADSHVNEPPGTFIDRVPARLRDKAPYIGPSPDGGEGWAIETPTVKRGFGTGSAVFCRGVVRGPEDYLTQGVTFADLGRGGWDPKAHLEDMKKDGADTSVLYSGAAARCHDIQDPELRVACLRAYNDWLAEFCSYDLDHLIGVALLPSEEESLDDALAELDRVLKLGYRTVEVPMFPRRRYHDTYYDPLWNAIQAADVPVSIHRGLRQPVGLGGSWEGPWVPNHVMWDFGYTVPLGDFIFGVFDRFPSLKVVSGEGRIGWLAFLSERLDDSYRRHRHHAHLPGLKKKPSEYLRDNVYSTFVEDRAGVLLREVIGVDHQMWSSDYPHSDSTWPYSKRVIEAQFEGVPEEDKQRMLALNAVELYKLN